MLKQAMLTLTPQRDWDSGVDRAIRKRTKSLMPKMNYVRPVQPDHAKLDYINTEGVADAKRTIINDRMRPKPQLSPLRRAKLAILTALKI